MTKDELEFQKNRIEKAEGLSHKIEQADLFCKAVEEKMDTIKDISLVLGIKGTVTVISINEDDDETIREFMQLSVRFFKAKNAARKIELSNI